MPPLNQSLWALLISSLTAFIGWGIVHVSARMVRDVKLATKSSSPCPTLSICRWKWPGDSFRDQPRAISGGATAYSAKGLPQ